MSLSVQSLHFEIQHSSIKASLRSLGKRCNLNFFLVKRFFCVEKNSPRPIIGVVLGE